MWILYIDIEFDWRFSLFCWYWIICVQSLSYALYLSNEYFIAISNLSILTLFIPRDGGYHPVAEFLRGDWTWNWNFPKYLSYALQNWWDYVLGENFAYYTKKNVVVTTVAMVTAHNIDFKRTICAQLFSITVRPITLKLSKIIIDTCILNFT